MKTCNRCNLPKDESEFHYRNVQKGTLQPYCKFCKAFSDKTSKAANLEVWKTKRKAQRKGLRCQVQEKLLVYLADKACVDCGEKDPIVLEFDHIHSKKANVAAMLNHHGWPAIQQEIEKCEIRCANCHRRRTAKQFGWFKVRSSLQKSNL